MPDWITGKERHPTRPTMQDTGHLVGHSPVVASGG